MFGFLCLYFVFCFHFGVLFFRPLGLIDHGSCVVTYAKLACREREERPADARKTLDVKEVREGSGIPGFRVGLAEIRTL